MNIDPLATALKEISETEALLQTLILSSEQFDYLKAKVALKKLSRKRRDLGKKRAEFESLLQTRTPNIHVLDFRAASRQTGDLRGS